MSPRLDDNARTTPRLDRTTGRHPSQQHSSRQHWPNNIRLDGIRLNSTRWHRLAYQPRSRCMHDCGAAVQRGTPLQRHAIRRHSITVRYETIPTCLIGFRTTLLWYAASIIPPQRFRTVPQTAPASENGGIPTTPRPILRCGTVRNQSNGLYRILYHTSVVRNAKTPSKKLPYRTTSSPCIRKRQNSNNLDANISAWYGTEPFQHA